MGEGSSTHNVLTMQYHVNGGRDRMSRAGGAQTRYAYDRAQRIDQLTQNFDGTAKDVTTEFDFNPAGQITRLARSNDRYHYFGNENKTGVYVSNGLNQYKSVNGRRYSYDANGNLTSDGVRSYDYDNDNRLVGVTGGGDEATFKYDPLGRLFEATVNGQTRQFLYDGDSLVAEYSSSGNTPVARYVHGDRVDEPWVRYNGSGIGQSRRVYLHTDHQGSIIAHSNGQGVALESLTYDSYGVAGAENVGRFGYTGQLWLGDIGLYYYKARMYSPDIGRLLQTDPIGYEDQMNLYAYVGNDPMNMVDPTGMAGCSDMSDQGVSGDCFESSNYDETSDGSMTVVSDAATDDVAADNMSSLESRDSENLGYFSEGENGEVTFNEAESQTTERNGVLTTTATVPSSASAVGHSHPERGGSAAPGPRDDSAVNGGRPNYIYQNGRVVVVERSGGQYRVRVVNGSLTSKEKRSTRRQLNKFQRRGR